MSTGSQYDTGLLFSAIAVLPSLVSLGVRSNAPKQGCTILSIGTDGPLYQEVRTKEKGEQSKTSNSGQRTTISNVRKNCSLTHAFLTHFFHRVDADMRPANQSVDAIPAFEEIQHHGLGILQAQFRISLCILLL